MQADVWRYALLVVRTREKEEEEEEEKDSSLSKIETTPTFLCGSVAESGDSVSVLFVVEPLALELDSVRPLTDAVARSLVALPLSGVRLHHADVTGTCHSNSHVVLPTYNHIQGAPEK